MSLDQRERERNSRLSDKRRKKSVAFLLLDNEGEEKKAEVKKEKKNPNSRLFFLSFKRTHAVVMCGMKRNKIYTATINEYTHIQKKQMLSM